MIQAPPVPPTKAEALSLPRPNPGPEPWADHSGWPAWTFLALALAATAALVLLARRSRRRSTSHLPPPPPPDAPAEAHLLALCDRLRAELAARLGPALRARTTEELAADPRVAELLGDDLPRLIDILAECDRMKFALRQADDLPDRVAVWSAWAASRATPFSA